jgi:hypothetical protein
MNYENKQEKHAWVDGGGDSGLTKIVLTAEAAR